MDQREHRGDRGGLSRPWCGHCGLPFDQQMELCLSGQDVCQTLKFFWITEQLLGEQEAEHGVRVYFLDCGAYSDSVVQIILYCGNGAVLCIV